MTVSHAIYRVESFGIVGPFTLRVRFDDETEQTIDFRPVLEGELYGPLRERELFDQVRVDTRSTLWCGRTARTSIRRRCTAGLINSPR